MKNLLIALGLVAVIILAHWIPELLAVLLPASIGIALIVVGIFIVAIYVYKLIAEEWNR